MRIYWDNQSEVNKNYLPYLGYAGVDVVVTDGGMRTGEYCSVLFDATS